MEPAKDSNAKGSATGNNNTLTVPAKRGTHRRKSSTTKKSLSDTSRRDLRKILVAKLTQIWESALNDLSEPRPEEELLKVLDGLIASLNEVTEKAEAYYLFKDVLTRCCALVMEHNFLSDTLHKKANQFLLTALTFSLASLDMGTNKLGLGAAELMNKIFRHRFFQQLMSTSSTSEHHWLLDSTSNVKPSGKDSLTASRRAKTITRLTEAVTLFTRQDGYSVIIKAIENAKSLDLALIHSIVDAVINMNRYIGVAFLQSNLPLLFSAVYSKLIRYVPYSNDYDKEFFTKIRDMLLKEASLHVEDMELIKLTQDFQAEYTGKIMKELPSEAAVLFLHYPSRKKQSIRVPMQGLKTIYDLKKELAKRLEDEADDIVAEDIELAIVDQGRIERVLQNGEHALASLTAKDQKIVAYHIPATARAENIVQVLQTKPVDPTFVPFNLYFASKEVPSQTFFERVAGSYIFTIQKNEPPFKLRFLARNSSIQPIVFNSNRILQLSQRAATSSPLNPPTILEVEWQPDADFEELQGYDRGQLARLAKVEKWATEELTRMLVDGSILNHIAESTSKGVESFVSQLVTVACTATTLDMQNLVNRVIGAIGQASRVNSLGKHKEKLNARFEVLLLTPDPAIRKEAATALCNISGIVSSPTKRKASSLVNPMDVLMFHKPEQLQAAVLVNDSTKTISTPSPGIAVIKDTVQFIYKLTTRRVIDAAFLASRDSAKDRFWLLPAVLKLLRTEAANNKTNIRLQQRTRLVIDQLQETFRRKQYLAQTALWLRETRFWEDSDLDVEWATGQRFQNTKEFFLKMGVTMPERGKTFDNLDILNPIFPVSMDCNGVVGTVTVKKVFTSKAKPLLLELTAKDDPSTSSLVIFKKGDDLRVDMLTQVMFYVFNELWQDADMGEFTPFIWQYKIIPMGPDVGCVELVENAEAMQTFDWNSWRTLTSEQKRIFLCSAAGGYVAGWVLGIRDRHQDNMLVRNGHIFFQIDFGHLFNEKPTIDAPRFAVAPDMKLALSLEEWELFKDLCAEAFRVLHRHASLIIQLCGILFDGIDDIDFAKVRNFLVSPQGLMVAMAEQDAMTRIKGMVESGVSSGMLAVKWSLHTYYSGSARPPPVSPISSSQ